MNHKKKNYIVVLLVLLAFVIAGIIYSCSAGQKAEKAEEAAVISEETAESAETSPEESPEEMVCVHVCGSVKQPGVYYLKPGSRVHEAIEMAGGMTEDADPQYVNLAKEAQDGSQIYIPSMDEVAAGAVPTEGAEEDAGDGLVNINTASFEELKMLPGIGDIKAEAIIAYRESAGGFSTIEDIMNVAGIKESSFEKIKEHIRV